MTSAKQICSPDKIAEEVYVSVVAYAAEVSPRKRPRRSENCALGVLVFEVGVFGAAKEASNIRFTDYRARRALCFRHNALSLYQYDFPLHVFLSAAGKVDAVWSLKQGYLLRGGTEESSPSLVQLRQLLSKLIVRAENRREQRRLVQ